jgi:Arc/MetJ-type ribon-helix-helix transcriptional regulator
MFEWLRNLGKHPPKRKILIYLSPEDVVMIDASVENYEYESRGDYIRHAIKHFKQVIKELEKP